jgi:hypothetical protein
VTFCAAFSCEPQQRTKVSQPLVITLDRILIRASNNVQPHIYEQYMATIEFRSVYQISYVFGN